MAHDARSVANFFLSRADDRRVALTPMSLLKILYFAHAWFLAKNGTPLVGQRFEAWKHGPVVRVVYDQIKEFGSDPITKKLDRLDISTGELLPATDTFPDETIDLLNSTFDYYSTFHSFQLSDLTHEKGGPWDRIWQTAGDRAVPGMIIPNELIKEWFERSDATWRA